MRCPHCETENRDDRASCYHCGRDLAMLRLIVNRARQHFNNAVEHAEHQRYYEALGELNNALELNSRFPEALVLRGTVLARLERLAEAEETWAAALALDAQANRAHRYLKESSDAREALPLLRRLRAVIYGAAGVAALSLMVAGGLLFLAGGADANEVRAGWSALHAGNLAESRRIALSLDDESARTELLRAIDVTVQTKLDSLPPLALAGNGEQLHATLAELDAFQLTDDMAKALDRQRHSAAEILRNRIDTLLAAEQLEAVDLRRIARGLDVYRKAFPADTAYVEQMQSALGRAINREIERRLQPAVALLAEPDRSREVTAALANALALAEEVPAEFLPLVDNGQVMRYSMTFADTLYRAALEAAERGDRDTYETHLGALRNLPVLRPESVEQAEGLEALFAERERRVLLASLQAAIRAGDHRATVQSAEALATMNVSLEEDLAGSVADARRDLAIDAYYALMEQADVFESGTLAADEAPRVLGLIAEARGPLPERLRLRAEENLLFFEWKARLAAGETEAADRARLELEERFPESPYRQRVE